MIQLLLRQAQVTAKIRESNALPRSNIQYPLFLRRVGLLLLLSERSLLSQLLFLTLQLLGEFAFSHVFLLKFLVVQDHFGNSTLFSGRMWHLVVLDDFFLVI